MKFEIKSFSGYNEPKIGQHPTVLHFTLSGDKGAIVWQFGTGVGPTGPYPPGDELGSQIYEVNLATPHSAGIFSHDELTEENATEDDAKIHENCAFLEGRACVCGYASFSDNTAIKAFACEGIPGVERVLRAIYINHYGEEP